MSHVVQHLDRCIHRCDIFNQQHRFARALAHLALTRVGFDKIEDQAKGVRAKILVIVRDEVCPEFFILETEFFKAQSLPIPTQPHGVYQFYHRRRYGAKPVLNLR